MPACTPPTLYFRRLFCFSILVVFFKVGFMLDLKLPGPPFLSPLSHWKLNQYLMFSSAHGNRDLWSNLKTLTVDHRHLIFLKFDLMLP